MKNNKVILSLTAGLLMFCTQSCLFEQADIFDMSSSERMSGYLDRTREILTSSEEGWVMEIFPEKSQSYGGWSFTLKFEGDSVRAQSEISEDIKVAKTSLYKLGGSNGPILSFDTYNSFLHYFATPSTTMYQSFNGEFNYMIMEAGKDTVRLRGTRTGNDIYMYRLTETADSYLTKVSDVKDALIITGIETNIEGKKVEGLVDTDFRQIEFTIEGDEEKQNCPFCITAQGIRLYTPLVAAGKALRNFKLREDGKLACTDKGMESIVFDAVFPSGWRSYPEYEGNYTFSYQTMDKDRSFTIVTIPVTLTPDEERTGFVMSGINGNNKYTFYLKYKKNKGCLDLTSQMIGTYDSKEVWLCAGEADSKGGLTVTSGKTAGLITKWNKDEANPEYSWVDNGGFTGGHSANSFVLCYNFGTTLEPFDADPLWRFKGADSAFGTRMYYLTKCKLTKVK